jgi:hypothetical protein
VLDDIKLRSVISPRFALAEDRSKRRTTSRQPFTASDAVLAAGELTRVVE